MVGRKNLQQTIREEQKADRIKHAQERVPVLPTGHAYVIVTQVVGERNNTRRETWSKKHAKST